MLGFAEITQGNFDVTRWPYFTGGGQKFRMRVQYGTGAKISSSRSPSLTSWTARSRSAAKLFYREASLRLARCMTSSRYGFDINARKALNEFTSVRFGYRLENIGIYNVDDDVSADDPATRRATA